MLRVFISNYIFFIFNFDYCLNFGGLKEAVLVLGLISSSFEMYLNPKPNIRQDLIGNNMAGYGPVTLPPTAPPTNPPTVPPTNPPTNPTFMTFPTVTNGGYGGNGGNVIIINPTTSQPENLISGIFFDCSNKPDGYYRDPKYCDVFHVCFNYKQAKTYPCPQVGERFYFDENTKK